MRTLANRFDSAVGAVIALGSRAATTVRGRLGRPARAGDAHHRPGAGRDMDRYHEGHNARLMSRDGTAPHVFRR